MKSIQEEEIKINLKDLFHYLWSKILVIIIAILICGGSSYAITSYYITPMYKSTAMIYILTSPQESQQMSLNDINMAAQLTADYQILISSRTVLIPVINELDLNMKYSQLSKKVTVENPKDTRILKITVENKDPAMAQLIAKKICNVSSQKIIELSDIEEVSIWVAANYPDTPSSPNLVNNCAIGVACGLIISCAALIILFIMNDKIKTPEDVEKQLDLTILGTLPYHNKSRHTKK